MDEKVIVNLGFVFTSLAFAIQCVPVFSYSSKFIIYAPFLILFGKLFLEYTPLSLGSFA